MDIRIRIYGYGKMMYGDDVVIEAILPLNELVRSSKRYKFMLSTNCYDKNDKEIYEHDILVFNYPVTEHNKYEVVYYGDGFVLVNLETRNLLGGLFRFCDLMEVVGNIYEGITKEV